MGHGISGERQRATCQEAFLPAVCFLDESAPAQVRHPCCPPLPGRDSESYVRDSSLVQSADLSQDPEQVICLLSYKMRE